MTPLQSTPVKKKFCAWRCCSKTARFVVSLLLIVLIGFLCLVVWVATGPRSLEQFTPQITQEINRQLDGHSIELEDIELVWSSWQSPLDAQFTNVRVYSPNGRRLAGLERVAVSANVWALLLGELVLDRLTLYKPTINIYRKPGGDFALDLGVDEAYGPELPPVQKQVPATLASYLQQANIPKLLGLSEFNIRGGAVNLGDTQRGIITRLRKVNLDTRIDSEALELVLDGRLGDEKMQATEVFADVTVPMHSLALRGLIRTEQMDLALLANVLPEITELADIRTSLAGEVTFALEKDAALSEATFDLRAGAGSIAHHYFAEPFGLVSAVIKGHIPARDMLVVEQLQLQTIDTTIDASAKIWQREDEQIGIEVAGSLSGIDTGSVANYWPPSKSPVSREWIVSNLTGGKVTSANVNIDIKPGMLEWDALPSEAIDAVIKFEGVDARFKPEFPPATNVQGVVNVNATQLDVFIKEATFLDNTKLSAGSVFIGDLNLDNPQLDVKMSIDTTAKELAVVLANETLEVSQELNLSEDTISGIVAGRAELSFPFTLPRGADGRPTADAYDYQINASLQKVSQPGFLEEYDLSDVTGDLSVNEKELIFKGTGMVFGTPLQLDVNHRLQVKGPVRTKFQAFGNVDNAFLRKIDVDVDDFVQGSVALKANIQKRYDDTIMLEANADLANALVDVRELGWQKPVGTLGKVKLVAEHNLVGTNITAIDFKSGDNVYEGSISLDAQGELQQIIATKLTLGDNNLQLSYAPIIGGYKIYAKGDYFDASRLLDDDENFSFKEIPALDVMVDLKKLVLDDGQYIDNLTGKASCNTSICTSVAVSGNIRGAKPMVMGIGYTYGVRRLQITSEDAGGLLLGLGVYDNMVGGRLNIEGTFNDSDPDHPMDGKLHLWDFQVNNTPTLARIVTLASFSGILNALQGNGLGFKKMQSTFELRNDVIRVQEMRANGDSIGITAEGNLNLVDNSLAFKGIVIPSYTVNSFLKNVPIVGEILTGGEAIIAANYEVSGSTDEPEVSVNPLSALAPGFLRKMFE